MISGAQVPTFGGNPQHTNQYAITAQTMNRIKWQAVIDTNSSFAHFGEPLVTNAHTVIVQQNTPSGTQLDAYDGTTGSLKYTLNPGYLYPSYSWQPPYQATLSKGPSNQIRLYYPGPGGTVWYVDDPDSNTPTTPTQLAFYGPLSTYTGNSSGFNTTVFIDTPITSDSNGTIFFGFRVQGTAPAPLSTGSSGYARIDKNGNASYVLAANATGDVAVTRDSHNAAPALSNDEATVYVVMKSGSTSYHSYLVALNATTLATQSQVFLLDPRNGNPAGTIEDTTSSPVVGPDGDVYLGVFANPYNGSRGYLAHFNSDLSQSKIFGGFGWDYTPGIVPASMVPSYTGKSSYLLFVKYNNYMIDGSGGGAGGGNYDEGNGQNMVAVIDPNATETDPHPSAGGIQIMREVMTAFGPTPDGEWPTIAGAVREMCVNATCVNPATKSVFFNSEDGRGYRWDLSENSISESLVLTNGIGEPYVPTAIGPDGTIYTLNGTWMFAMGKAVDVNMTMDSSAPSLRSSVLGDSITFTAKLSGGSGTPTGTVHFEDLTYGAYDGGLGEFTPVTVDLGTVPVDGTGHASVTTSALTAGGDYLGNHFITATYSGDGNYGSTQITRVQKVHPYASVTTLGAVPSIANYGTSVVLNANVGPAVPGSGTPTGMVLFRDGGKILGQVPVDGSGNASLTTSSIPAGNRTVTADYYSDTYFAASLGTTSVTVTGGITTFGVNTNTVKGGQNITGTVTISTTAPAGGAEVALASNKPRATVPATVTIPEGASTANFTIATNNNYNTIADVTITATFGASVQQIIHVQPNNDAQFDSQTVPTNMVAGQSYPVTVKFKNTGGSTWFLGSGYKLQSQNPTDNTTWGSNRLALSYSVAPGGTGIFTGTVIAPSTAGTYNFQWKPIEDSISLGFGTQSPNVAVTVAVAADAARYISKTGATTVYAGSDFYVQNTMQNVGTNSWTTAGGYSLYSLNTNWGPSRAMFIPGSTPSVAPGAQVTFTKLCTAPITPGVYPMQWQMLHGPTLFGDKTQGINMTVVQGPNNAQFVSSTFPAKVAPSTAFTASFTMKNLGTATWDNTYALASTGANFGVASIPVTGSVAQNGNATFTGTFTAPATPGTYTVTYRMQNGSSTKFGQTASITVVVGTGDAAQFISKTGAVTVDAGSDFWVQNTMANVGSTSWSTGTNYWMMSQTPANNTTWGTNKMVLPGAGSVAPGAQVTLTKLVQAPTTPGSYTMQWQMSNNGTAFGSLTPLINMTVVQGNDNAELVSQTGVPTSVVHGTNFSATITMKNLGFATWSTAGGYSLKAMNPAGNTTWGPSSIAVTGSVAPNANGTFTGNFTAPSTPGTYHFQWRMNHNTTGFGQYTTDVTITVT